MHLFAEFHITYDEAVNSNLIILAVRETLHLQIHSHHSTLTKSFLCVRYAIIGATYTEKEGHKLGSLDPLDITPDSLPERQRLYKSVLLFLPVF